jgi:lipoprotein-anchoring transpeptidase ErfK/SrfK
MEKKQMKPNKIVLGSIIGVGVLFALYLGMSIFFMNHFYFGTIINNVNAAGKTVAEVEDKVLSQTNDYTLELEGRGDIKEEIKGSDIGIKFIPDQKIQELKDSQNGFGWIGSIFKKSTSEAEITVDYDEGLLIKSFDNLSYFNNANIVNPENAKLKYSDNGYEIVEAVDGNKVIKDTLYDSVVKAIHNGETKIVLDSINSYESPKYTSSSEEIISAKEKLDKYIKTTITYNFGSSKEVINGNIIKDFVNINNITEVDLDPIKVRQYVDKVAGKYNTYKNTRNFSTSTGKTVQVSGGNYGWILDKTQMVEDIIANIKDGQTISKELIFAQTAESNDNNDIGNTYLEINLTKQHIWLYKNGTLVIESDVVTGNESLNCSTPAGTYRLNYKEANATLKGEDYSTPVAYWMPFNNNIGVHDATWRDEFGGEIYKTNGSHGCVNAPYETAKTVFENVQAGMPVVCYTE